MNSKNNGRCTTNNASFMIPTDNAGNSVLTGEKERFTCNEIEVFEINQ